LDAQQQGLGNDAWGMTDRLMTEIYDAIHESVAKFSGV
jgi:hypothetical protein